MRKKIIVFADGTGNAFSTQESNVWRLYQALDQTRPDQICRYIRGVGTSGFRPFALLDGATGIGVPANVRELYRFICWNWNPGDEIYMFGFSRGSFTIRTLVGLIHHEGLVPAIVAGTPVSHSQMQRNASAAWRSYRTKTAPSFQKEFPWINHAPTIPLTRLLRDGLLWLWRHKKPWKVLPSYSETEAQTTQQGRKDVTVTFVGLFDTVEAFGVPIEEVRGAIDRAIWPISFRNKDLSGKVQVARHALALNDERTTFHPLLFDMTDETTERIKEVWFAGVHSDVGGGYPDGSLAYVPLVWMADEVGQDLEDPKNPGKILATRLRFASGAISDYREYASAFGPLHDSRSGTAVSYRYEPRTVKKLISRPADHEAAFRQRLTAELTAIADPKLRAEAEVARKRQHIAGKLPVIHHSVVEKMVFGSEKYAPFTLPADAKVLMPDNTLQDVGKVDPDDLFVNAAQKGAVQRRLDPDPKYVERARDAIWWRRVGYFALLLAGFVLLSLPKTAESIGDFLGNTVGQVFYWLHWLLAYVGIAAEPLSYTDADRGIGSILNSVSGTVGGFLPGYLAGWVEALVKYPLGSLTVIGVVALLFWFNGWLRERIADESHKAWFNNVPPAPEPNRWYRLARTMRGSSAGGFVQDVFTRGVVPIGFLVIVAALAVTVVSRTTVTYRAEEERPDQFCQPTLKRDGQDKVVLENGKPVSAAVPLAPGASKTVEGFSTSALCWASGIHLDKDVRYTIFIDSTAPFFDRTIITDIAGFSDTWSWLDGRALFRRWWSAEWFAPIARINATGGTEWPLKAVDGLQPLAIDKDASGKDRAARLGLTYSGTCNPIPEQQLATAKLAHEGQNLRRRLVSEFTAPATGELYLYVNDAIMAVPFGRTVTCFYDNNRGTARVTVERYRPPATPQATAR